MPTTKHVASTHHRPQISDLFALRQIEWSGEEETHAGITRGLRVEYQRDGGRGLRDETGEFQDTTDAKRSYYGIGGGRYDEHGKDIIDCEATLVGKDLGLLRDVRPGEFFSVAERREHVFCITAHGSTKEFYVFDPKLRDLFQAVARDDICGSPPFSLGNLTTTMYTVDSNSAQQVRNWANLVLDAIRFAGPVPEAERETAHRATAAKIRNLVTHLTHNKAYHSLASTRVAQWLEKRMEAEALHFEPCNLIDCVTILERSGTDWRRWARPALLAELHNQHLFHTATACEAKKARLHVVDIRRPDNGETERRYIAVVQADDERVKDRLFSAEYGCNAAAVVQKNSKGQVQIFPGGYRIAKENGRFARFSFGKDFMPFIAAAIRAEECRAHRDSVPRWHVLTSHHGPRDLTWFYHRETGWFMNGALTAPDVQPTKLPLDLIVKIVVRGFDLACAEFRRLLIERLNQGGFYRSPW